MGRTMNLIDIRHIAAVSSLASAGVAPDVQELLVAGSPMMGVGPGALAKAIDAALTASSRPVAYACKADIDALTPDGADLSMSSVPLPQWGMEMALYPVSPPIRTPDIEELARIIEPTAWRWLDTMVAPFAEGRGANEGQQTYHQMWMAGIRSGAEARAWCVGADNIYGMDLCASLAKAKIIAAAISQQDSED